MSTSKQTPKGATVVEYIKKYPDRPKMWIGKKLHKDHPSMFPDAEAARKMVVTYSTKNPKNRVRTDLHGSIREKGVSGKDAWENFMPDSWSEELAPFKLPTSIRKLAVLSDCHVPYHDTFALKTAIQHCINEKPDAVLLNGDTMDFYAVSDHEKDPRLINWKGELEAGRMLMEMLRKAFPNIPIYYKSGNHCFRAERYLMKYAPILLGIEEFELPSILRLGEYGIEHINNKVNIWAGKLNIIHGDEYKGSGGVNPARWLSLRTGDNSICGHFHRTSTHLDRTIRQDIRGWWSTGCLCELTPKYLPYNQWNSGFAIVSINSDQSFEVENLTIVSGKVR